MSIKSTKQIKPYAGWSTLNKQDVLQSVSNSLRKYRNNRPELKLKSHRDPEQDGVTHWTIRSNGNFMCNIYISETKSSGIKLSYELSEDITKEMRHVITHEAKQLHEHIKTRIDADNNVGTHWEIPGIPRKVKIRIQWKLAWDEIQLYRRECRDEGRNPTLDELVDHFKYPYDDDADANADIQFYGKETIQKIIKAGEERKLDNVKSH